jgi:phospholipid transport system substrate-binding protein
MIRFLSVAVMTFTCAASALLAPRTQSSPDVALKATVDQLLVNFHQHAAQYRGDQRSFYEMVDKVVVPRFDVPGIAQFALGKYGRDATPEQRQRFADTLALTLVHSYANLMLERYDTMVLVWNPARTVGVDATRATINSVLTGNGGQHYPVGFSVRLVDGDWKIYDLEVEGVSLALNYRAQLGAEIKRTSLDAVIARMTKQDLGQTKAAAL